VKVLWLLSPEVIFITKRDIQLSTLVATTQTTKAQQSKAGIPSVGTYPN
jgi:hypothetical protein